METTVLAQNVQLHVHPCSQFKDVTVCVDLMSPLIPEEKAARMCLSFILQDVCRKYPTKQETFALLDRMYGADYSCYSDARGNAAFFEVRCTAIDARFIDTPLLEKQFALLHDFLLDPLAKNGQFDSALFEESRQKAVMAVRLLRDDPMSCCMQNADEFYGGASARRVLPKEEELNHLSNRQVFDVYQKMLKTAAADLFVLGQADPQECIHLAEKYFLFSDRNAERTLISMSAHSELEQKTDTRQMGQSCLVMMYDTSHVYLDPQMPAMMIGNGILGGLPTSYLFQEIREKRSLCYSISSENRIYDGVLCISTAMQEENIPLCEKLIAEQIDKVKNGEFSDEMLETARRMYISSWRSSLDSVKSILWDDYRSVILNRQDSIADMIHAFEKVSREQIAEAFSSVQLKSVYLLKQEDSHE